MSTPPTTSVMVGVSSSISQARAVASTGSPRTAMVTRVAETKRSDQFSDVCPSSCGTTASSTSIRYVVGE